MNLAACWLSVHRTHHTLLWGDDWLVVMVTAAVAAVCSRAVMLTGWPPNSWTTRADVDTLGRPGSTILSYLSHHCQSRHTRGRGHAVNHSCLCVAVTCHLSLMIPIGKQTSPPISWPTSWLTDWPTDWPRDRLTEMFVSWWQRLHFLSHQRHRCHHQHQHLLYNSQVHPLPD